MKRYFASTAAFTASACALLVAQAAPASAVPFAVYISTCEVGGGTSPNALCDFQVTGGVGAITVTGVGTGWSPTTNYSQYPYSIGSSFGPCPYRSHDSITITAVDSTGAKASASQSFLCVLNT